MNGELEIVISALKRGSLFKNISNLIDIKKYNAKFFILVYCICKVGMLVIEFAHMTTQ